MRTRKTRSLLLCLLLAVGCAGSGRPELLSTPIGGRLEALWELHGGVGAWKRFRAVTFSCSVETPDGEMHWPEIAIRFDQPGLVWVREPRNGEAGEKAASPGSWRAFCLGVPEREEFAEDLSPAELLEPDDELADFSLRSIRLLFHLPFALGDDGWEIRAAVTPPGVEGPWMHELEAMPTSSVPLLGPFLLSGIRPATSPKAPPRSVTYASSHPAFPAGIYEVRFLQYRRIQGVVVATEREHRRWCRPKPPPEPDPLQPHLFPAPEPTPPILRERLSDIRFLTDAEFLPRFSHRPPASTPARVAQQVSKRGGVGRGDDEVSARHTSSQPGPGEKSGLGP